jgi:hypothetical protein
LKCTFSLFHVSFVIKYQASFVLTTGEKRVEGEEKGWRELGREGGG